MTLLEKKLTEIKKRNRIGLMTHLVIGYPNLQDTITIAELMAGNGADIIELQIPFSDPLADGPTIMKACEKALENGTRVKDAFTVMETLSARLSIPILFMAYYNTVFHYGVEQFCKAAKRAGAAGLIVPDMPIDEENEEHFYAIAKKYNLHTIQVLSPVTNEERMKKNRNFANGFVYCTARQGITGVKDTLDPATIAYLKRVRKNIDLPLAVGFGISKKEHLQLLAGHADIAVIGSAVIEVINKSIPATMNKNIKAFFQKLQF